MEVLELANIKSAKKRILVSQKRADRNSNLYVIKSSPSGNDLPKEQPEGDFIFESGCKGYFEPRWFLSAITPIFYQ